MKTRIAFFFSLMVLMRGAAWATDLEAFQLQQLVESSQKQLEALKTILTYQKQDAASLDRAGQVLEDLSQGIHRSLEKYRDTDVYQQALIELQSKNDFKKTYRDSQQVRERSPSEGDEEAFKDLVQFQKESVEANQADLSNQQQLQQALKTAQPGFIPRIEAQTQLGSWQANTRVSAQMTELLAAIHAMREELRSARMRDEKTGALSTLVNGSEEQNAIQRQEKSNGR